MNLSPEDIARLEARKAETEGKFREKHPALARAGLLLLGMLVFAGGVFGLSHCVHAASGPYAATVVRVIDGDTVLVNVDAWQATPFALIRLRIAGIDTPESHKPPAKCKAEVLKGQAAAAFGKSLAKPGDRVSFMFLRPDKYGGRIDASVALPSGQDWATAMLSGGYAVPYKGGTKRLWCQRVP